MNEIIDCLFDTNAIVKYWHESEEGADKVKYLFDSCPTAQLNICNSHIPEVVSVFHKLRLKNEIKTDDDRDKAIDTFLKMIPDQRIMPYKYDEKKHQKRMYEILKLSYTIPPPLKRVSYIYFLHGYVHVLKDLADIFDIHMLTIMEEIKSIVGESYLVTSDSHVIALARALNLPYLNPEQLEWNQLPPSLCRRGGVQRKIVKLKVVCRDCDTNNALPTTKTIDISRFGARIEIPNLPKGKNVQLYISDVIDDYEVDKIHGKVVRSTTTYSGVRFDRPLREGYNLN